MGALIFGVNIVSTKNPHLKLSRAAYNPFKNSYHFFVVDNHNDGGTDIRDRSQYHKIVTGKTRRQGRGMDIKALVQQGVQEIRYFPGRASFRYVAGELSLTSGEQSLDCGQRTRLLRCRCRPIFGCDHLLCDTFCCGR